MTATNLILVWIAATNVLPIVRAIVEESYVGRYPMIGFGSIASRSLRLSRNSNQA
ncbi:hypothetical protein Dsin_002335 [Dipteronia sinensis]|uniref:Uncharacterized protein n=1 Tax=Dipteronia sinensis TaxID=43782 RepID=A0AAE0EJL0_9ROSI|nr:hypothetical protein Dsin_002335 [Dipteronia sinensis]